MMISTTFPAIAGSIRTHFIQIFGTEPILVNSPGRVNLIGEHTDYNEGFVLPAAIDKGIVTGVSRREDKEIHVYASDMDAMYISGVEDAFEPTNEWPDYIIGVVDQFRKLDVPVDGFNLAFGGDIPMGAGMSSSAALECSVAFALNELFDSKLSRLSMVMAAQRAENEFVGVKCGIMDQFASMFGRKGHVIRLDCRSLEYDYVPFKMEGFRIVLLDTNVKHTLGSSEYNVRRIQCEKGMQFVRTLYPEAHSLRDVTISMLNQTVKDKDGICYKRCRYVVEENVRLLEACQHLTDGDMEAFGNKMFQTHAGLSKLYEVSCPELDYLAAEARTVPGVLGARMMGGGFGGCTINVVKEDNVAKFIERIGAGYAERFGKEMGSYIISIANGTERLT